ncbi:hypothetical protein [Cylindrospermopsis raciborskii]|uniref:hypothetical protein n=1 Tax=Cylindrospermopsis raciborskii TaxID=77022 RepID=UPI0008DD419F|nr:hypothetical protein [Cylindrospermopsis raciborskii]NLQ05610.1 hypothetical protein [Cylindrospermopsis raciborskii MVCC19]OHY34511.1 hypothetical protein BCV64_05465 [Cylindrospermopsis raciborskii MVCC14]
MNIWIITIGNSDVQLKNEGKRDWSRLRREAQRQGLLKHDFDPEKTDADNYRVPARVMGIVIGNQLNDENYQDLHFPMLDIFSEKLQDEKLPHRIIVILTNQDVAYNGNNVNQRSPYWKDTCTLKPILDKYLKSKFPDVTELEYVELQPKSKTQSLDNWDQSLSLVQTKLLELEFNSLDDIDNVYVSHQAGTPAISSAIQFVTLAKFGKKVKFLVSNEYEPENTIFISSSNYLRGIQLQEAKRLLQRFDYSGLNSLLHDLKVSNPQGENLEELLKLLEIATQWNCAKFDKFLEDLDLYKLTNLSDVAKERSNDWWQLGYEAAYLAVIRIEQGNTVEAMFHSFRAVEGLIRMWAKEKYETYIDYPEKGWPKVKEQTIKEVLPSYKKNNETFPFNLLKEAKPECEVEGNIMSIFVGETGKKVRDKRNELFHKLLGLKETDVFEAWDTTDKDSWKTKVLDCLNFVSDQSFKSLEEVSVMYKVHQLLNEMLNDYKINAFVSHQD